MEKTDTNWSKSTRYIAGVGLALFGILILYLSRSVIPLLIVASLIAVIVRPLILWLHNSVQLPRSLSVVLIYLIMAILFPLAVILIMPAILDAGKFLQNLDYSTIIQNVIAWFRATLNAVKTRPFPIEFMNVYIGQTVDSLLKTLDQTAIPQPGAAPVDSIIQSITETLSITFRTAAGVVASFVSSTAQLLFTFLASVYLSLSAHTFIDAILRAAPERFRPELAVLIARIERTWKAFFRGELTLMLFIGVIVWLGLTILGIPGAPYLGIAAGLLEIVPNIGPVLAAIPAVIISLLHGSTYLQVSPLFLALLVILFYILVQQFENNLIVPKVLGKAVNLPALVVMTGVLVGAQVGGLLGVLLATPMIATMRDIVCYIHHKILGENPFPYQEELQKPTTAPRKIPWNKRQRASLKADVYCSDGAVGFSTYLIGNPINHQMTHLVVQSDLPPHYEYLVPFQLVEEVTPNLIKLKCTQEEFQQMMLFKNEEFIPTKLPGHLSWPYCVPVQGAIPEEVDYIAVEHQIIPLGEQVMRRGARVEATDGTIGEVEELLINARGMQITHLVLLDRQFLKKRKLTIPISLIDRVDEDTIYLKVNRQNLEALPTTPIQC